MKSPFKTTTLIALLALIFTSCMKGNIDKEQVSVLDIIDNAKYGDTHAFSEWYGRYWEVFGNRSDEKFSALTTRISTASFDAIKQVIEKEFGPYEFSHLNIPNELISNEGWYWHCSKPSCNYAYYWRTDSLVISWAFFEMKDDFGYAYIDIYEAKK